MNQKFQLWKLAAMVSVAALVVTGTAFAKGDHELPHGEKKPHMDGMMQGKTDQMPHGMDEEGHAHKSWADTPEEYAAKRNPDWEDSGAGQRGMAIFAQQCASCHGLGGKGDGQVAAALTHKPANLSKHFHIKDGRSDAYLFWRVSEGGMVEPFKSTNSAMPAFKQLMNEQERWDVLTFIHQQIHKGFNLSKTKSVEPHDMGEDHHG